MRKHFLKHSLLFLLISLPALSLFADDWSYGVRGGLNINTPSVSTSIPNVDTKAYLNMYLGGMLQYNLSDMVKFGAELNYEGNGYNYNFRGMQNDAGDIVAKGTGTQSIGTITFPIYAKYQYSQKFSILLGIQTAYQISDKNTYDSSSPIAAFEQNQFKVFGYGALAGVQYFVTKKLFVDARYNLLLNNTSDSETTYKGRSIQIGLGIFF